MFTNDYEAELDGIKIMFTQYIQTIMRRGVVGKKYVLTIIHTNNYEERSGGQKNMFL